MDDLRNAIIKARSLIDQIPLDLSYDRIEIDEYDVICCFRQNRLVMHMPKEIYEDLIQLEERKYDR